MEALAYWSHAREGRRIEFKCLEYDNSRPKEKHRVQFSGVFSYSGEPEIWECTDWSGFMAARRIIAALLDVGEVVQRPHDGGYNYGSAIFGK